MGRFDDDKTPLPGALPGLPPMRLRVIPCLPPRRQGVCVACAVLVDLDLRAGQCTACGNPLRPL